MDYQYDVFIFHAEADWTWVQGYLLPALGLPRQRTITRQNFRLGVSRVQESERAVTRSRYTVLVLSPAYLADEWAVFGEQLVSHYTVTERRERLIPLLKVPCELPLRIDFRVRLDCTNENNWESELARLRDLLGQPECPQERIPCPYPGMVPFSAKDTHFFYGRDTENQEMLQRLRLQRFLFIIGPSGSGKSSLIRAGLLSRLSQSSYFPPGCWLVREMRPGATPLQSLAQLWGGVDVPVPQPSNIQTLLATNPPAQRLLLVIDQFEELFTQTNRVEQSQFIAVLKALRAMDNCTLLVAMRADFYPDLMHSDLWPVEASQRLEIAPLRGEALRHAIEQPAVDQEVHLESGLVERLLADAADEPGVLPLLQETMVLLWGEMQRHLLTLDAYKRLGGDGRSGLATAIAMKADSTLAELTLSGQKTIARRIFLRLVQFGEGRADTRRQQSIAALRSVGDDPLLFDQTLRHLVDNRLLTLSGEERGGDKKVDIAHEALLKSWPVLYEWLSERRVAEQTRRRLEDKADEWVRLGRGSGGLLDAAELPEAERWLRSTDAADLGYDEVLPALVQASRRAIERAVQEQARANKIFRWGALALGIMFVIAVGFAMSASRQKRQAQTNEQVAIEAQQRAERQRQIALARQLAAQSRNQLKSRFDLSLLLSLESNRFADTVEGKSSLLNSLQLHPYLTTFLHIHTGMVWSVAFSFDGKTLAAGSGDNILLWDVATRRQLGAPLAGHTGPVNSVAFSPDDRILASSSGDMTVRLWDMATRQLLGAPLTGHTSPVEQVAFSPDGRTLASGSDDRTIRLWDVATRQLLGAPLTGHTGYVGSVAFSPDGRILASSSGDKTVRLWDVATRQLLGAPLTGHMSSGEHVVFSPDGKTLASAGGKAIILWDMTTDQPFAPPLAGHTDLVRSLAFSPDGKILVSCSLDNTVILWDMATRQPLGTALTGHANVVTSVTFSPDGKVLASGSYDKTILLWDVSPLLWNGTTRQPLGTMLAGHKGWVGSVTFSPDGKTLASGSTDENVRLWDVVKRKALVLCLKKF